MKNQILGYIDTSQNSIVGNELKFMTNQIVDSVNTFQGYCVIFMFCLMIAALINQVIKGG